MVAASYKRSVPVVIVGAGPAGAALSLTLTKRGVEHLIADATLRPSTKPGEAIPPNALPLFRQLGIEKLLDIGHRPYYGNEVSWGDSQVRKRIFFGEPEAEGRLLDRGLFERQLRQLLVASGAHCLFGYKLQTLERAGQGISVCLRSPEQTLWIKADFVVDATGRKASVCRHLQLHKQALDRQFALAASIDIPGKQKQYIRIASTANGWWYLAPVSDRRWSAMFFTHRRLLPQRSERAEFMRREWQASSLLCALSAPSQVVAFFSKAQVYEAAAGFLPQPYGSNWLAVGDAAYTYNPISSYGITSALAAGYYGGHALADELAGKRGAFQAYHYIMTQALQAYLYKLGDLLDQENRWLEALYWRERKQVP